jgi:hypothetical protein
MRGILFEFLSTARLPMGENQPASLSFQSVSIAFP